MNPAPIDPRVDRKNGMLYFWATLLTYLAAPVLYVDVVQAALCDRLGASATVANLPASTFFLGSFAPIVFACFVPHRWERFLVVSSGALMALLMAAVVVALVLPLGNGPRLVVVIGQSLILGLLNSVNQVYIYQCLGRGTTEAGRSWCLKLTFTLGPIAAVAGSLLAQFVLGGGIPFLAFPWDFAALYLFAVPCMAVMAWCCQQFELAPLKEEVRPSFFSSLRESFKRTIGSRDMVFLWLAYLAWFCTFEAMSNLSLFTRKAMGREPSDFSGVILALRFGFKALAGYGLGLLNIRYGVRAPLLATVAMLGLAMLWAWFVPGYFYLAAFGLMGAGELGGVYFPNTLLTWSPPAMAARDMSILNLATPASAPAATLHGFLADHWGFPASFIFGIATAASALVLICKLPKGKSQAVKA